MPSLKSSGTTATGKAYWRSLDELADTEAFRKLVEREFPSMLPSMLSESSRRTFMKLMGASTALAGLAGCRWPRENILPYAHRPEGRTPGVPVHYATSMDLAGISTGLLAKSMDGRPIKIEGNPEHPGSLGATNAWQQASVLDLYDPDRSTSVVRRSGAEVSEESWETFDEAFRAEMDVRAQDRGRGLVVLSEANSSPTTERLREKMRQSLPEMRWYEYEPLTNDAEREGTALAFGQPYRAVYQLQLADVILCIDADPLLTHPNAVRHARDFANGRTGDRGHMSRLYAVETTFSLTGSVADHRLAARAGDVTAFVQRLAGALVAGGATDDVPASVLRVFEGWRGKHGEMLDAVVDDLLAMRGRGLIIPGSGQPAEVHTICHILNRALGNAGATVAYAEARGGSRPTHMQAMRTLSAEMKAGDVQTLLILGGNPAYDAPADVAFADALDRVPFSVHLSLHDDETSERCTWQVPRAHYLEAWGDGRAWDGTYTMAQPLIAPLFDGRSVAEILAVALGEPSTRGYDLVRETLAEAMGGDDETRWRKSIHDGFIENSADRPRVPSPRSEAASAIAALRLVETEGFDLVLRTDPSVFDGRFANNGWLQETPDPLSTVAWDNVAAISPHTARELGASPGDLLELSLDGRTLQVPAYVMPGHADGSVSVTLGYGRRKAGRVGNGVGFDTYALRTSSAPWVATGLTVSLAHGRYKLAVTQDHWAIDRVGEEGRDHRIPELFREATLAHYKEHPNFAEHVTHHPPLESLFTEWKYPGHAWGMGIDLSRCIGCRACMLACQAENNVPVVGKDETERGREMHWIRVDRYFSGPPESPQVAHQPVTCHHCENAPCEQVCPVAATLHDSEGLNVMVYNRCVGTRYCSNNCPYKVRRFNWFNNQDDVPELERMVYNPEVTVRARGVMEKCSFCVQRIKEKTKEAKNAREPLAPDAITPACAQACPSQAIVFGDLSNEDSTVREWHLHDRSYAMLSELNVKPRLKYLAKIRNPKNGQDHEGGHGDAGSGGDHTERTPVDDLIDRGSGTAATRSADTPVDALAHEGNGHG